jgi:hypothetical protein
MPWDKGLAWRKVLPSHNFWAKQTGIYQVRARGSILWDMVFPKNLAGSTFRQIMGAGVTRAWGLQRDSGLGTMKHLKTCTSVLNWIRLSTGSQCKFIHDITSGEWQNTFWAIHIFMELIFYLIFYSNWISSHIHLLICLPSPDFHYNGKLIMQIPEVTS